MHYQKIRAIIDRKTKTLHRASLHSVRSIFHLTKIAEIEYEKGTLANKDGMSYNIPCGNGLEAVV